MVARPTMIEAVGRTLGQLVMGKMALVAICRRCKHRRVLYPANYVRASEKTVPAIVLRGGCAPALSRPHGEPARSSR